MDLESIVITTKLALVDAINPCTLAIQAYLLSNILVRKGRRDVLISGLLFSLTIFFMYFLYGLIIKEVLSYFYSINFFILTFLLSIMVILEFKAYFIYKPGFLSLEMPIFLRPYAKKALDYAYSKFFVILVGILLSLFLLPCSSGPYLVFIDLFSSLNNLFLFIYYLLIFISPMVLITLLVYLGLKPEKVLEFRNKYIRKLHLISGILLLLVLIYVLFSYF